MDSLWTSCNSIAYVLGNLGGKLPLAALTQCHSTSHDSYFRILNSWFYDTKKFKINSKGYFAVLVKIKGLESNGPEFASWLTHLLAS